MYKKMTEQVKEFYISFKQEEFLEENGITPERMVLRNKLWNKKCEELVEAISKKDKVQMLDAIVDMMYARIGALLERYGNLKIEVGIEAEGDAEITNCRRYFTEHFGHNSELLREAFNEVHRSNMSKLDENGDPIFREDGKIMKSHLFIEPDLKSILEKYGEL